MHIIDAVYSFLEHFAPMDNSQRNELRSDAHTWYSGQKDTVFKPNSNKELRTDFDLTKATLKQKAIYWCENWAVRTCIAILYVIAVPWVKNMYNGDPDEQE